MSNIISLVDVINYESRPTFPWSWTEMKELTLTQSKFRSKFRLSSHHKMVTVESIVGWSEEANERFESLMQYANKRCIYVLSSVGYSDIVSPGPTSSQNVLLSCRLTKVGIWWLMGEGNKDISRVVDKIIYKFGVDDYERIV